MDLIAFPVSFDSTGFKKFEQGTDDYYRQLLTLALITEPDSLPLTPAFGVNDPTFTTTDRGLFIAQAAQFVPEVIIRTLDVELDPATGQTVVAFSFEVRE